MIVACLLISRISPYDFLQSVPDFAIPFEIDATVDGHVGDVGERQQNVGLLAARVPRSRGGAAQAKVGHRPKPHPAVDES